MAFESVRQPDGAMGRPSRRAPRPRTASYRTPVAWLTTRATRAPAPSRTQRLVANHGMPRDGVGRPVDRVEDDEQVFFDAPGAYRAAQPALLGHDGQAGPRGARRRGSVGDEIQPVLAGSDARLLPVVEPVERGANGDHRVGQHRQQGVVVHRVTLPPLPGATRHHVG